MLRSCILLGIVAILAGPAQAHYNMLLPSAAMAKKGEKVAFVYQFGHPFEHELFDAPKPAKVEARTPAGKLLDLTKKLEKFKKPGPAGKDVTAWKFDFTPEERGDYWFIVTTPPIWMEEAKEYYQDVVQVLLHVETQNGWKNVPKGEACRRLYPLTRPYGLPAGMVFQAETNCARLDVEIERYNPQKPKEIPTDELVTFVTQTDSRGVLTCNFPDPGWWSVTVFRPPDEATVQGKKAMLRERVTLWVHVEAKASSKK